ncbi:MAG: serine protease [Kofleriaceae bacterium]
MSPPRRPRIARRAWLLLVGVAGLTAAAPSWSPPAHAAGPTVGRATPAETFAARVDLAVAAIRQRIAPEGEPRFVVWGRSEGARGNPTLRRDLARFAVAAEAIAAAARETGASPGEHAAALDGVLALLARYHAFITARWPVGASTEAVFAGVARAIATSRPANATAPTVADNPYLARVDDAIDDPAFRAAIRAVQPATVKLGGGSGVNLAPDGLVLTNAHVADALGNRLTVAFPDGRRFEGVTVAFDARLDLALLELRGARGLPVARLAARAPSAGIEIAVIGQPGTRSPEGAATGYQPWHVSTGTIRGFVDGSRTGDQHLGRTKHDAWTYWGHSGSPLFDRTGAVVGLHNSWDARTAMRHAVTWEAIAAFLAAAGR